MFNSSKFRVLVVDDDPIIADVITQILSHNKFDARVSYDPQRALSLLDEFKPEAMITDFVLPGMSGIELAEQVRQRLPSCRILMLSGYSGSIKEDQPFAAMGDLMTVLTKPVDPQVIVNFVARCAGHKKSPALESRHDAA